MSEPIVFIPLTQGKVAVVDFVDFEVVRQFRLAAQRVGRRFYAIRSARKSNGAWTSRLMHTDITEAQQVDHRNGNGLDNRRCNLRSANTSQNLRAFVRKAVGKTSRFRGVSWDSILNEWVAHSKENNKSQRLGRFDCEEDAARAYDAAISKMGYAEEALNFPPPRPADFEIL